MRSKFFPIIKNLLNWFKGKSKAMSPDLLVLSGIPLFAFVFTHGSLPAYMPQSARTDSNPEIQLKLNKEAELNKNIYNGLFALNITLVAAYFSIINLKLKESDSKSTIISIPTKDLEYLSLIQSALEKMPDRLDGISNEIDTLRRIHGESGFLELLHACVNDYKLRQDALSALSKGLENVEDKESIENKESLRSSIRTSITEIVGKDCDKDSTDLFYR